MNTANSWVASLHKVALATAAVITTALAVTLYETSKAPPHQQHAGRANPWRGVPGCITIMAASGSKHWIVPVDDDITNHCGPTDSPIIKIAPQYAIPPGFDTIQLALDAIRKPPGATTALNVASGAANVLPLSHAGRTVAQGQHVHLTLHADTQRSAQAIADCMTGDAKICTTVKLDIAPWQTHYEGAPVRMIGLLVMDAYTGKIEALGSSMSPCYRVQHSSTDAQGGCLTLPTPPARRPHRLTNRALYAEAMPASLVKPVLALALLRAPLPQRPSDTQLRDMLRRSDSEAFLDALFCKSHGYADCGHIARAVSAARDLAWNQGCHVVGEKKSTCARLHLYNTAHIKSSSVIQGGRIFYQPVTTFNGAQWQTVSATYPAALARECAERQWHRCDGAQFASLSAEAWGQGNALATPTGVAAMFSRLAVAANSSDTKAAPALPHLIDGAPDTDTGVTPSIHPQHAQVILDGLAQTHRAGGTAHSACIPVFGHASHCNQIDWIHGKTGTPVFAHERYTAQTRVTYCHTLAAQLAAHQGSEAKRRLAALHSHCAMSPYKWYAALVKHGNQAKVVVVLVERNYNARTGMVDALNDRGANLAAVAALAWAKQWQEHQISDTTR